MIKVDLLRYKHKLVLCLLLVMCLSSLPLAYAQETECAEVKIIIEQKLSFERQAFDAKMIISNGLSTANIKDVAIDLHFLDKNEQPVKVTQNPNDLTAKFFYKVDQLKGIQDITGQGEIPTKTIAEIHWLIIPSKNAVGQTDELYYVGATVRYNLNGVATTVEVTPDYVVVRPLPELTLDYFLPKEVFGDDPLTETTEPIIPFTLGVRVKNTGHGPAFKAAIESAQPKIVANDKNLLVNYEILGSYVDDVVVDKSLLINFGDIMPAESKVGRWLMTSSLYGEFVEFNASYTHADGLGGEATSLIKDIKTHTLIRDVKVPSVGFPDRDEIRDFLAEDDNGLMLYESQGMDTKVTDVSALTKVVQNGSSLKITKPATKGFTYIKVADPFKGQKSLVNVAASFPLIPDNFWLSKERNKDKSWSYFINIFDVNNTAVTYEAIFTEPVTSSISGRVFNDKNNNGLQEEGESGIGLVKVTLTGINDKGLNVSSSTFTSQAGDYSFVDLNPGNYSLTVDSVNGERDGLAFAGAVGGESSEKGVIKEINLPASTKANNYTFAKLDIDAQESFEGSSDLSVFIIPPAANNSIVVGKNFSIGVMANNKGPDIAKGTAIEFKLPDNLQFVSISKGYEIDSEGVIKVGDLKVSSVSVRVTVKPLDDNPMPLEARIRSQVYDPDLKYNTHSTVIIPEPNK
ncbi:SdrD B-like domain-containing protein [Pseudomonas sp. F1_0610]|uniref:SdrD B-like domain-containing protein n=1 Tax=Pseudomonas sp. F1_0610 TaxID=3114284 RepID=UPI0039C3DF28